MYSIYKLYDIMELEQAYVNSFSSVNPNREIDILPPVLKKYKGKLVLAYLVIAQPQENQHHSGVCRPIGAILRNRKTKKVLKLISCDKYEFAPDRNDFVREYYSLEDYPDYWPNRTSENDEQYRLALEELYRVSKTIKFGWFNKEIYASYKERVRKMFPQEYWYFFEAIEQNEIEPINEEILYQRQLAKTEHGFRLQKRKIQQEEDTEKSRTHFITETKEQLAIFIRNDILPSLKRKQPYAKIDFYAYVGKTIKKLENDTQTYISCYIPTLTGKARVKNKESAQEGLKVNMIKTYAKACVKPLCNDADTNNICSVFLKFLHVMALQEATQKITEKTKEDIAACMAAYKTLLDKIQNSSIRQELSTYYDSLNHDYFEAQNEHDISDLYAGYKLVNSYLK